VKQSLKKLKIDLLGQGTVSFWGKISGTERDYLILGEVTTKGDRIQKSFHVSTDLGLTFSKLPETDGFVAEKSNMIHSLFKGNLSQTYKDPAKVKVYDEDGEEEEEEEEEDEEDEEEEDEDGQPKKPKERKLTEVERLSYTVQSIDDDTNIAPLGAFQLTPTGEIIKNNSFPGLSPSDVSKLGSFVYFRDPVRTATLARIRKAGIANIPDFLDQLGEGKPTGVYSVQTDASGLTASVRSLEWLGHEFNCEAGSTDYSSQYFGNGLKNHDVQFMI